MPKHSHNSIKGSLNRLQKWAKMFYFIFAALLIFFFIVFVGVVAFFLIKGDGAALIGSPLQGISLGITILVIGLLVYILMAGFRDVAHGASPFSFVQSRRFLAMGILLELDVVFEALASTSILRFGTIEGQTLEYALSSSESTLYIDMKFLIAGLVCFFLVFLFRYGALLQQLSDDTV